LFCFAEIANAMKYKITIEVKTRRALKFMEFIKVLAESYNFIKIEEVKSGQIIAQNTEVETTIEKSQTISENQNLTDDSGETLSEEWRIQE